MKKTPEPTKVIRRMDKGHFEVVFEKKAQADFKGTLAGGRAIAFEAKHTTADRIEQDVVSKEQGEWLDLHERVGALCFVVASVGPVTYARVPWAHWKAMREHHGRKYMTVEELRPFRVPLGFCRQEDGGGQAGVLFLEEVA